MKPSVPRLSVKRLGIDTYKEAVIYMRKDCQVCLSEGFEAQARVRVSYEDRLIIATLNFVTSDLLPQDKIGLSEYAWELLQAKEGGHVTVSHQKHLYSLSSVRSKIYGNILDEKEIKGIIEDIVAGRYSDIHIATFLTAYASRELDLTETSFLTKAMIESGETLYWPAEMVVDKHCVGGLPGNRTTPIIVAIVAAYGLTMPKTSSRAITSPAGTADTMEVLAPVDLNIKEIKKIVSKEKGCIAWGGSVALSPADDMLIRVERAIELDSEGQLVASILSKKIAAGSTHVVIDMPIGPTAKVRSQEMADILKHYLESVGHTLGIVVKVVCTDGTQPVGRGIGPALEARDIVEVLTGAVNAPADLRERAITLAGSILEFSPQVKAGEGCAVAEEILVSGRAWKKFQDICAAQGGMREIPKSRYQHTVLATGVGHIGLIDNRHIARIAKLAGAPHDKTAGVDLHVKLGHAVHSGTPLFTVHAGSPSGLSYALAYVKDGNAAVKVGV
jgi:thymidine phosphorylase